MHGSTIAMDVACILMDICTSEKSLLRGLMRTALHQRIIQQVPCLNLETGALLALQCCKLQSMQTWHLVFVQNSSKVDLSFFGNLEANTWLVARVSWPTFSNSFSSSASNMLFVFSLPVAFGPSWPCKHQPFRLCCCSQQSVLCTFDCRCST